MKHILETWALPSTLRGRLAVLFACLLFTLGPAFAQVEAPVRPRPTTAEAPQKTGFRAVSYEVFASLAPENQMLTARAIVEFEAQGPSRTLECQLHPNLTIGEVRDSSGNVLEADRNGQDGLDVSISLPNVVPAGQSTTLTFQYSGVLSSEENSPITGVRLASIGKDGAYLLLPARWFPLTDYPSNRFTGIFHIEVPQNFAVIGTGANQAPAPGSAAPPTPAPVLGNRNPDGAAPRLTRRNSDGTRPTTAPPAAPVAPSPSAAPSSSGSRITYTFRVDQPEDAGTFVAGALQLFPVQAEGLNISVYLPPNEGTSASDYGNAIGRIVNSFSDLFGALPNPKLTIAQIPDGTLPAYSAPGLLLLSQREWGQLANTRQLSNLVAGQWWGNQVMAASPSDVWLTDGLARYSEALYVEQSAGRDGVNRALNDFAIGALMYDDTAPIGEAGNLMPFTPNYTSVVVNKGAMVFHMLREQLGDAAFSSLLRDYYKRYAGKAASLADFEKMAQDHVVQAPAKPANFALGNTASAGSSSRPTLIKTRSGQRSIVFRSVDQFDGNSRIQYYVYRLSNQSRFPHRRQGETEPRFLPHAGGNRGPDRRQSRNQDH